jgi:hypothetical protein
MPTLEPGICDCGRPTMFADGCYECRKKRRAAAEAFEASYNAMQRYKVRSAKRQEKRRLRRAEIRRMKKAGVY